MRFKNFENREAEKLGEGAQKEIFADPDNPEVAISKFKNEAKPEDIRRLKGSFYLTKIAHLLFPNEIPDIYQAGTTKDRQRQIDRQKIPHSKEHAEVAVANIDYQKDKDSVAGLKDLMAKEARLAEKLGYEGTWEFYDKLRDAGLMDVDPYEGNFTDTEKGDVFYLEEFQPWIRIHRHKTLLVQFNSTKILKAIEKMENEENKKRAERMLDRLETLLNEELKETGYKMEQQK